MTSSDSARTDRLEELVGQPSEELAQKVVALEEELKKWEGTHQNLRGVILANTQVCDIDPGSSGKDSRPSKLVYAGFDIGDLARHSTVEETAYLIMHGHLPNQ